MLKKINLKNKIALVTGAGKGIGKACAIALAEAGAKVIILSRTNKDLATVSKIIKKFKVKCRSYTCDVTNYNEVKNVIDQIPRIDILVNNAGTNFPEHFTEVKRSNMEYMVKINNIAAFNLAQLCTLKMLKIKNRKKIGGSIINRGGQNPLEAARFGAKIFHGPNTDNFKDVYKLLKDFKISKQINTPTQLASSIIFKKNKHSGSRIKNIGDKILKKTIKELDNLFNNEFKKT